MSNKQSTQEVEKSQEPSSLRSAFGYMNDREFVKYVDQNYNPYKADEILRASNISRMELLLRHC